MSLIEMSGRSYATIPSHYPGIPTYNSMQIVPQASAVLQYDGCPTPVSLYQNHREVVKFESTSDAGFLSAIDGLTIIAKAALASREQPLSPGGFPLRPTQNKHSPKEKRTF